jgi:hypothetical protein
VLSGPREKGRDLPRPASFPPPLLRPEQQVVEAILDGSGDQ